MPPLPGDSVNLLAINRWRLRGRLTDWSCRDSPSSPLPSSFNPEPAATGYGANALLLKTALFAFDVTQRQPEDAGTPVECVGTVARRRWLRVKRFVSTTVRDDIESYDIPLVTSFPPFSPGCSPGFIS